MDTGSAPVGAGEPERTWAVGELAEVCGITVRTLHHYDRLGLLRPSSRTRAGHRRYRAADVRRLHRILALRGFGLSLSQVRGVLDTDLPGTPRELIARQLRQAEEQVAAATRLRDRLRGVLGGLDAAREPSTATLLDLMEAMMEMNRRLTVEEFDAMARRRKRWAEGMTEDERARAAAARQRAYDDLTDEERARMRARRAALRPEGR